MPDFVPPIALIRRICYPTSVRLPQRALLGIRVPKKVIPTVVESRFYAARNFGRVGNNRKGNLNNEEYRFFIGKFDSTLVVSTCRWCGDAFYSAKARKDHEGIDCHRALTDLYKKLIALKKCAICQAYCSKTYWGVPLCGDSCQEEWRFTMPDYLKKYIVVQIEKSKKKEAVELASLQ